MRSPAIQTWLAPAVLGAAILVWALGLHHVDPAVLDGYGLVTKLSPLVWLGFAGLVAAAIIELRGRIRDWVLALISGASVVMIYGLQALTYGAARLPIGWLHIGFADQILNRGVVIHDFDTRFSWPGFFTTAAMWARAAGFDTVEPLIKWAPVVLLGLAALAAHTLARAVLGRGRAAWIATLLFIAGDWTEQEYFSPQGLAYVMLLSALAITASTLVPSLTDRVRGRRPWRREQPANSPGLRITAQLFVILIACALAPSHQLTPFMLAGFLLVLLALGRLSSAWLGFVALIIPVGWFVLGAQEFWVGQLSMLTTGAGDLSSSINQGIAGRVAGSAGHQAMVLGRIGLTGLVGVAFLLALVLMRRRGRSPWTLAILAAAAFGMAVLQPYGGEIFMRCYLFALPWFAIGIAWLLADWWDRPHRRTLGVAATAGFLGLVLASTVVLRGGNDAYVAYDTPDVVAVRLAVDRAQPGQTVMAAKWLSPLRLARVQDVPQLSTEELSTPSTPCMTEEQIYHCLIDNTPTYIVLAPDQELGGEILGGLQPGWVERLNSRLQTEGQYHVIYSVAGRTVLANPQA